VYLYRFNLRFINITCTSCGIKISLHDSVIIYYHQPCSVLIVLCSLCLPYIIVTCVQQADGKFIGKHTNIIVLQRINQIVGKIHHSMTLMAGFFVFCFSDFFLFIFYKYAVTTLFKLEHCVSLKLYFLSLSNLNTPFHTFRST